MKYEIVGLTYEQARDLVNDRWCLLVSNGHAYLDNDTLMRPEGCRCDHCKLRDQRAAPQSTEQHSET